MMNKKNYDCLVAAGTTEAHEAIEAILGLGMRVLATVATELGADVLKDLESPFLDIEVGRKTEAEFIQLIYDTKVRFVIDATHPFATEVTRTLKNACAKSASENSNSLKYIRFVRENMDYSYKNIVWVKDAHEAAKYLNQIDGHFLLTTGANTVHIYKNEITDFNARGYVRVLDTKVSIEKCQSCDIDMSHVIAKNPPFSESYNDDLIHELDIKAMVSKDSGVTGGLPEKIASAKKAGIPVILIERPESEQGISDRNQLIECLLEKGQDDFGNRRIMLVGTGSGCGKTTVTCALMKALKNQGYNVAPFKCGPDYIDPMFHKHIVGKPSINLDLFFLKEDRLKWILNKHLEGSSIAVIEGVMGMYDGIGNTTEASAFDVAMKTGTPMILVVNAKGMSASICAMIQGYKNYGGADLLKGVILNNVGKGMYLYLKSMIEEQCGVVVLGYMERQEKAVIESRHLGLITAEEIEDLDSKIELLGKMAETSIDLEGVMALAESAEPLNVKEMPFEISIAAAAAKTKVKLAVAMDKAFCFYYEDNLAFFRDLGIELLYFSPLAGEEVPKDADGLYLGGGYPEVYAKELSGKLWSRFSIRNCWSKGMPIIAECGGFMYLHDAIVDEEGQAHKMCGLIPGTVKLTDKLGPFGYIDVITQRKTIFGEAGMVIRGHEFHYSVSENQGKDLLIQKPNGRQWVEGHCNERMYAGYPHLYFYSEIQSGIKFKQAMIDYHKNKNMTD